MKALAASPVDGVPGATGAFCAESLGDCDRDILRALAVREMLREVDRGRVRFDAIAAKGGIFKVATIVRGRDDGAR